MKSSHQKTANDIERLLKAVFTPTFLQVIDDSHAHRKHTEALRNPEMGHFHIKISSSSVKAATMLEKHRLIYNAIAPIMDKVHACKITLVE